METLKRLKSVEIDTEKGIYKVNGEDLERVRELELRFEEGNWTLLITKDEFYKQAASKKSKVQILI